MAELSHTEMEHEWSPRFSSGLTADVSKLTRVNVYHLQLGSFKQGDESVISTVYISCPMTQYFESIFVFIIN